MFTFSIPPLYSVPQEAERDDDYGNPKSLAKCMTRLVSATGFNVSFHILNPVSRLDITIGSISVLIFGIIIGLFSVMSSTSVIISYTMSAMGSVPASTACHYFSILQGHFSMLWA